MNEENDDISRLLRLKRFEQPPPEYFDHFLREFQDRQRSQLLRDPAWRIAWDRLCAFFGEQLPVQLGYSIAVALVLLIAGVTSFNILQSRPVEEYASAPETTGAAARVAQVASLNLNTQVPLPSLPSLAHTASFSTPRYVMDARPVSYEPPSSF
jgi:hypothetical protein